MDLIPMWQDLEVLFLFISIYSNVAKHLLQRLVFSSAAWKSNWGVVIKEEFLIFMVMFHFQING